MRVLLCAIGKMENRYIREWVEWHKGLGFDSIVLYDNNDYNGERFEDVIGDYIELGYVVLKDKRGLELQQVPSYNECYREYEGDYDWICFWDIDEFLEMESCGTIQEFLGKDRFAGENWIRLCWKVYTDGGNVKVKDGDYGLRNRFREVLTLDYLKKHGMKEEAYWNVCSQSKAIVRTGIKDFETGSPHVYMRGKKAVDALGRPCENGIKTGRKAVWEEAWLCHYMFKSSEEFASTKMVRLWPTAYKGGGKGYLNQDYFFRYNVRTKEKEETIGRIARKNEEEDMLRVASFTAVRNFGDMLNFEFLPYITKQRIAEREKDWKGVNYLLIGSLLSDSYVNKDSVVWGSGTQHDLSRPLTVKPKKVLAVRGPLSRKFLTDQGIKCPAVYGDPALLMPMFYNPEVKKRYRLGIIPHWQTKTDGYAALKEKGVKLIDLRNYKDWRNIVKEIKECERVASESLHGLILAEAYGVPNVWVNMKLDRKHDIKFHDFFLSMGADRENPVKVDEKTTCGELYGKAGEWKPGKIDLGPLIQACPFKMSRNGNPEDAGTKETVKENTAARHKNKNRMIRKKAASASYYFI